MKRNKWLIALFVIFDIALLVGCIVFLVRIDRTPPVFTFEATDVVYREGMDNENLLTGVTARDARDGDVTGSIVIEKVVTNAEEQTATVYFAVSDKAGNVAKASRVFRAVLLSEGEDAADALASAGIDADLAGTGSKDGKDWDQASGRDGQSGNTGDSDESGDEQSENGAVTEENASASPFGDAEDIDNADDSSSGADSQTSTSESTPSKTPDGDSAQTDAQNNQNSQNTDSNKNTDNNQDTTEESDGSQPPTLTLKQTSVKTTAGTAPAWVNLIGTLSDDKDSYETLFHNLIISKYDVNTPGTYSVTIQTEDSNGNRSDATEITIEVQ